MEVFALFIFFIALAIHYPQPIKEKQPDEEYTVKIYHKKKEAD